MVRRKYIALLRIEFKAPFYLQGCQEHAQENYRPKPVQGMCMLVPLLLTNKQRLKWICYHKRSYKPGTAPGCINALRQVFKHFHEVKCKNIPALFNSPKTNLTAE